ncbi:hypothetical protein LUZ62_078122 [Rhynchospora pubera]|uniref:DUF7880 domain-containing protein n=1 Tax=Rhynchospora pubera TaxID=906938 RepID=A0AAV8DNF6_9POAL|nr:hypothetical protein LUZ62_078122 [Rhynchospora pubera]
MTTPLTARGSFLRGANHRLIESPTSTTSQSHRRRVTVTCSVTPPSQYSPIITRRSASISAFLFFIASSSHSNCTLSLLNLFNNLVRIYLTCFVNLKCTDADASPFDKYVKRKKLEPLEAYVPAVLLSQDQFKDLEKSLELEQPRYDESRSLLRSGPAASLRVNIRAVAQYANDSGKGKVASDAVDQCLRALEDLDSLLLHALRKDPGASVESMKGKITVAIGALNNLLQTVPSAILDKGKAIAEAYRTPSYEEESNMLQQSDPEIRRLEAIL